ncbi:hypothetical protein Q9L42_020685 (plasmid) [Methylomarinum sp. Ch1-1]|uniref:Uncharacterized protein n=1 Tax=Methylomarinum roseum TaxID=3067653 RepID=A0AAU7P0F0_9GAMM|nr:hypothetical protein [Methylomarinum sp. Ch1-1]MDP4523336.1 hypothetical protein [Methylomarinum sp. Ch1-1]
MTHVGLVKVSNGDMGVLLGETIIQTAENQDSISLINAVERLPETLAEQFEVPMFEYEVDASSLTEDWSWSDIEDLLYDKINTNTSIEEFKMTFEFEDWDKEVRKDDEPYAVEVTHNSMSPHNIAISVGNSDDDRPELEVLVEVNKGVPAVHVGGALYDDMDLHVYSTNEGLFIASDQPGAMEVAKGPFTYGDQGYVIRCDDDLNLKP